MNVFQIKNLHLTLSSFIIIGVGLIYGVFPSKTIPYFFNFNVDSIELYNIFRATMSLYIGISIYWIIGVIKTNHWKNATLLNVVFMGSLAFGRIASLLIDGFSIPFSKGLLLEFLFCIWGLINLYKYKTN